MAPVDPWKGALKLKIPPSEATSQYPPVVGSAAIPTMGLFRCMAPVDPWKGALKLKMPAVGGHQPVAARLRDLRPSRRWGRSGAWPRSSRSTAALKLKIPPSEATSQ